MKSSTFLDDPSTSSASQLQVCAALANGLNVLFLQVFADMTTAQRNCEAIHKGHSGPCGVSWQPSFQGCVERVELLQRQKNILRQLSGAAHDGISTIF